MAQVIVRNLPDDVIDAHRRRAKTHGVSLEQELRDVLARTATRSREERLAEAAAIRARNRPPPPGQAWPTAQEMIREDRDSR